MDPKKFFSMHGPTTVRPETETDELIRWRTRPPTGDPLQEHASRRKRELIRHWIASPAANRYRRKKKTAGTTELTGFGIHGRPRNHRRQHFLHRAAIETARVKPTMWCITRICPPCTPQNPQHASYFVSVFIGLTRAKSMWWPFPFNAMVDAGGAEGDQPHSRAPTQLTQTPTSW